MFQLATLETEKELLSEEVKEREKATVDIITALMYKLSVEHQGQFIQLLFLNLIFDLSSQTSRTPNGVTTRRSSSTRWRDSRREEIPRLRRSYTRPTMTSDDFYCWLEKRAPSWPMLRFDSFTRFPKFSSI